MIKYVVTNRIFITFESKYTKSFCDLQLSIKMVYKNSFSTANDTDEMNIHPKYVLFNLLDNIATETEKNWWNISPVCVAQLTASLTTSLHLEGSLLLVNLAMKHKSLMASVHVGVPYVQQGHIVVIYHLTSHPLKVAKPSFILLCLVTLPLIFWTRKTELTYSMWFLSS